MGAGVETINGIWGKEVNHYRVGPLRVVGNAL